MKKMYIFQTIAIILSLSLMISGCFRTGEPDLLSRDSDEIRLSSSDTLLTEIFNWAKSTSNGFVGDDNDPVGPWYEAALPGREAFCIRDISHQSIGAEILGQGKQNLNMFRRFVSNISEEKDYCTYWEINRYNLPAPVDYRNDQDFWYNLNANFDIIDASLKLFEWTGDSTYIADPVFDQFFRLTLHEYVERWQLEPEDIMDRPAFLNRTEETVKYLYARGIPSYDEGQEEVSVSGDLLGMILNGYKTNAKILELRDEKDMASEYLSRAEEYRQILEKEWWDEEAQSYYAFYTPQGTFYHGGVSNSEFLLWYHVIEDPVRIEKSLRDIHNSQVEVLSYLPMLYFRYGHNAEGYEYLKKILQDERRNYPEASSGAIEGIVRGMLGVEPSASQGMISTCPRLTPETEWVEVENIPVFSGHISVHHASLTESYFANKSDRPVIWRAMFQGAFETVRVNGKEMEAMHMIDQTGKTHSYTDVRMKAGEQSRVFAGAKSHP